MRSYIRHPSEIPVEIELCPAGTCRQPVDSRLRDVGMGGISFVMQTEVCIGMLVRVRIPVVDPCFEALGRVTRVDCEAGRCVVAVGFLDRADAYRARMVEQICHIEQYRRDVRQREGRRLSPEEAAREWIERHAAGFPSLEEIA